MKSSNIKQWINRYRKEEKARLIRSILPSFSINRAATFSPEVVQTWPSYALPWGQALPRKGTQRGQILIKNNRDLHYSDMKYLYSIAFKARSSIIPEMDIFMCFILAIVRLKTICLDQHLVVSWNKLKSVHRTAKLFEAKSRKYATTDLPCSHSCTLFLEKIECNCY